VSAKRLEHLEKWIKLQKAALLERVKAATGCLNRVSKGRAVKQPVELVETDENIRPSAYSAA